MDYKKVALLCGAVAAICFSLGRYSAPEKIKTEIKVEKVVEKQEVVRTVTKVVERPDGTKETEIVQDSETNTKSDTTRDKVTEVTITHNNLNISLLAGAQPKLFQGVSIGPIVYGASVSKEVLGPITVGAFGLSDLTFGASIGFNF